LIENPFVPEVHAVSGVHEFPLQNVSGERTVAPKREPWVTPAPTPRPSVRDPLERIGNEMEGKVVLDQETSSASVEQYRRLAASLHHQQVQTGLKTVMVSSAMPQDGKTLTSTNLALTLSESFKRRVLLVDADLRRPSIHTVFRVTSARGLADGLRGDDDGALPLIEISQRLAILPAGAPDRNPMAGLTSERLKGVLSEAASRFDWVILDTPPIGLISDANLLAELVDGVLIVIGAGSTDYTAVQRMIAEVGRERILGVVLNRVQVDSATQLRYQSYHYGASDDSDAGGRP
jgi:capsular exopolysaccharide synthesis family protein